MKKILLIIFVFLILLSCNKDTTESDINNIEQPQISALSPEFILTGDILTITGSNFVNENFETKVVIDNTEYDVNPISNNEIQLEITNSMGIDQQMIKVKIEDKNSSNKEFFIIPRGDWYKIDLATSKFHKVKVFPNSNKIYYMYQNSGDNPRLGILNTSKDGFNPTLSASCVDFVTINEDICYLATEYSGVRFTTDGFENINFISYEDNFFPALFGSRYTNKFIEYNENMYLVTTGYGHFRRYIFNTEIFEQFEYFVDDSNLSNYRINKIVNGTDGYYYTIGDFFDYTTSTHNILAMKSSNAYDDWSILHNYLPYDADLINNSVFIDYNLLYSIDSDNRLLKSTDVGESWELIENDISSFFAKNEIEWYKVSNDKLYYSSNSGTSWEYEFDLPIGSEALYMDFTENKSIIAGDGFIFINYK